MSDSFQTVQQRFADHLRDPGVHAVPTDVDPKRAAVYADLFYNNIEGLLGQCFPVLRGILSARQDWHRAVRCFFSRHRCSTPHFPGVPFEFVRWLQARHEDSADPLPPFAAALAHYEWSELDLDIDPSTVAPGDYDPTGDLLTGAPVLTPAHRLLDYDWPVSRIRADWQPTSPEPERMLLFRDVGERVRFIGINTATRALAQGIREHPGLSGAEHLAALGQQMPNLEPSAVLGHGAAVLEQLRAQGAILGTRPSGTRPTPTGKENNREYLSSV